MAHRPEDQAAAMGNSVTVRLPDLEPIAGLVAATARFCAHLNREAVEAMGESAVAALSDVQSILWRLEHARPEPDPPLTSSPSGGR
jgi:hypothetical protein